MVDQQYLLNDEGVQNFIKNGYVTVHPDLPDLHEEIYRETAAIFEKEGDPRNHILQKVPALYQVFAHPDCSWCPNQPSRTKLHDASTSPCTHEAAGPKRWCLASGWQIKTFHDEGPWVAF